MNVIKVTLGFLELAFALKFLSVADLAYGWRLLDRETFLALCEEKLLDSKNKLKIKKKKHK